MSVHDFFILFFYTSLSLPTNYSFYRLTIKSRYLSEENPYVVRVISSQSSVVSRTWLGAIDSKVPIVVY